VRDSLRDEPFMFLSDAHAIRLCRSLIALDAAIAWGAVGVGIAVLGVIVWPFLPLAGVFILGGFVAWIVNWIRLATCVPLPTTQIPGVRRLVLTAFAWMQLAGTFALAFNAARLTATPLLFVLPCSAVGTAIAGAAWFGALARADGVYELVERSRVCALLLSSGAVLVVAGASLFIGNVENSGVMVLSVGVLVLLGGFAWLWYLVTGMKQRAMLRHSVPDMRAGG
jgi:hypothetical protein